MALFDGDPPNWEPLTLFLMQLLLIVVLCRILAYLFSYIKQPPVVAEVIAGILLGPSAMGKSAEFTKYMFPPTSITTLNVFANIGLIVFMFLVGLELDPGLLRRNARNSVIISVTAMVFPFGLGLAASVIVYEKLIDPSVPFSSFLLFVAVALSITAFPVLARILAETRMLDDKVGNIALSSAAVDDVVAWCLLALVVAIARAKSGLTALYTFLVLFAYIAFMLFAMRPLLTKLVKKSRQYQTLKLQIIALLLIMVFVNSWFTEIIGVHAIFGAFLTGVITPRENRFAVDITERIEDLTVIILLPLYFTYSGLRTNLRSIDSADAGGLTVLIIVVACVGKIVGATLAARFTKNTWRESFTVGFLMNTKGLVELIVLNLGLDVGVLNIEVFTMFVIMAIVTTCLTSPVVHFIYLRHRTQHSFQKENYQLVLYSSDKKTTLEMISFASTVTPAEGASIKAILYNELSERPSSYFFHLSTKLRQDVPFFKDKAKKGELHTFKKAGTRVGVAVSTKGLNSLHLADDVVSSAKHYACDMIMVGVNSISEEPQSLLEPAHNNLSKSISSMIELKFDQFFGSDAPASRVIRSTLKDVPTQLGVFISKTVSQVMDVKKVLFLYNGLEHEVAVFETVLKMKRDVNVELFTSITDLTFDGERTNIQVINTPEPVKSILTVSQEKVYDLIIVGSQRNGSTPDVIELIKEASTNILVVFPAAPQNSNTTPFGTELA